MIGEKILEWTKKQLDKGKSEKEVMKELKNGGYSKGESEKILRKAGGKVKPEETEDKERQKEKKEEESSEKEPEKEKEDAGMGKKKIAIIAVAVLIVIGLIIGVLLLVGVSAFYWLGGITTEPPTAAAKPRTITVTPVNCGASGGSTEIEITNTSPENRESISAGSFQVSGPTTGFKEDCPKTDLGSEESTNCEIQDFGEEDGVVTIFGNNMAQTQITC